MRDSFGEAFISAPSICVLSLPGAPDLGLVVNSSVGGDLPAWCYLGTDSDGAISAVAVALVTDVVYRYRPASADSDVIASVERLVAGLTADDEEAEQLRESWADFKEELASSGGVLSANLRNRMHEMHESFERV